jgi:hypothetical protein
VLFAVFLAAFVQSPRPTAGVLPSGVTSLSPIPSEFPALTNGVAAELQTRECRIPQPQKAHSKQNVIRGHFLKSSQTDIAVLCATSNQYRLLVFWSGRRENVTEVFRKPIISTGYNSYGKYIATVGKKTIIGNYEAFGAQSGSLKPPPLDHEGINYGIYGCCASTIYYLDRGTWLRLGGGD